MKEISETSSASLSASHLQRIAAQTRDLPILPVTTLTALEMTKDPNASAKDLQYVIGKDQALSARVLRIVNSAMYCLSREVSTLSHAVAILGMDTIRSILMATAAQQVFQQGLVSGKDLGTRLLMDHSWGAAAAARAIAVRVGYENPEEAFLCGLMHDIGKPVMLKNFPDKYRQIFSEVYKGDVGFNDAESRVFGFSHAEVGALIAEKWKFPPQMVAAIGWHHDPLSSKEHTRLASITCLSNLFMVVMEIGFEKDKDLDLSKHASAQYLNLNQRVLETLVGQVRLSVPSLMDTLKI
jgi:putative nucleotidyltransferase with HDIG domain